MKQPCDKICQFCHFNFLNNFRQSSPYDDIFLSKTKRHRRAIPKFVTLSSISLALKP